MKIRNGYGETKESHTVLLLCSIIANFTLNKAYRHVSVCVCVPDRWRHTLYRKIKKALKYNALQGHMLPLVKILCAWERERKQKGEKKDIFELLCYQPLSDYLSISLNSFYSSSCLSTSPFPFIFSLSLSHKNIPKLSLSPGVRMRVGHRGDLRALLPLSARCVCLTESVCKKEGEWKENSNYSFRGDH